MLSGKAPFQGQSRDDNATSIIERIKGGEFSLRGPEWNYVSDDAKSLIQGRIIYICVYI